MFLITTKKRCVYIKLGQVNQSKWLWSEGRRIRKKTKVSNQVPVTQEPKHNTKDWVELLHSLKPCVCVSQVVICTINPTGLLPNISDEDIKWHHHCPVIIHWDFVAFSPNELLKFHEKRHPRRFPEVWISKCGLIHDINSDVFTPTY